MQAKAYWGYGKDLVQSWHADLEITAEQIRSCPICVAELHKVVGFYMLVPGTDSWRLQHLWIQAEFMRRGIGRTLLTHALERATEAGAAQVFVDADPNAEGFYLKLGANRIATIAAPIPGNQNRVRPQLVFRLAC